jgi:hypothetical protein
MDFPGHNKLELGSEATESLFAKHLGESFGNDKIRVTHVSVSYGNIVSISFTTDPKKELPPAPPPELAEVQDRPAAEVSL